MRQNNTLAFLIVIAALAAFMLPVLVGGCGTFVTSAKDRQAFDNRAKNMRDIADLLNSGSFTAADMPRVAYVIECEAEAAQNLKDMAHWKSPTFKTAPLVPPTCLPWNPQAPTTQPAGGQ